MSNSTRSRIDLRTWVTMAMLTAVAYVVMYLSKMLPSVNGFLDFDFKDVVICIGGFIYGPVPAAIISIVVALIEAVTISHTGPIGLLMNVLATCSFCCTATLIYKKHRTMKGAIVGLAVGVVLLVVVMLLWNYLITPVYQKIPREVVAAMLPTVFLPFNLAKGGMNMAATLLLYKPVVTALRKAGLAPKSRTPQSTVTLNGVPADGPKSSFNLGFLLFSLALLATFVTLALVLWGVI